MLGQAMNDEVICREKLIDLRRIEGQFRVDKAYVQGSRRKLAASTRAYAKIITDVNQLGLKDLQRPATKEVRR